MSVWTKPTYYELLLDGTCPRPDSDEPVAQRRWEMAKDAERIANAIGRGELAMNKIRRKASIAQDTKGDSDGDDGA